MNAFVLSGGANLGAIQAGMLEALTAAGIHPDILVGTSIGAANAAFLAADPTSSGARSLADLWRGARPKDILPLDLVRISRALMGGGALFSPSRWRRFLERALPYGDIQDARVPVRIVATRFEDGGTHVFASGPVVEAVLASTALPGVFPPHDVDGRLYLDGGLTDQVPLSPAVDAGADTIYVLSVGFPCPPPANHRSARVVLMHSLAIALSQRLRMDSDHLPRHNPALRIVQIPPVCAQASLRDFSHAGELIDRARAQTSGFLESGASRACRHATRSQPVGVGSIPLPDRRDLR